MMKKALFIFVLLLASCIQKSQGGTTPQASISPSVILATATKPAPVSTVSSPIHLQVSRFCPERLSSVGELGFPHNLALILAPTAQESVPSYYVVSSASPLPTSISFPVAMNLRSISSDYKMMLLEELTSEEASRFWIAHADDYQKLQLELSVEYSLPIWLNNGTLLAYSASEESFIWINPIDSSTRPLLPFPEWDIAGIGGLVFINDEYPLLLYQKDFRYWLFDPLNGATSTTLEWLWDIGSNNEVFVSTNVEGDLQIKVRRDYGVDFSPYLSISELNSVESYEQVMRELHAPEGMEIWPNRVLASPELDMPLLVLSDDIRFVWFDASEERLNDYCLYDFEAGAYVSPDWNFSAFTDEYLDPESGSISTRVIVVNMSDGRRAVIDGYRVVDWSYLH